MIKINQLRHVMGSYAALFIFAVLVVGGIQFLILSVIAETDFLDMFKSFYDQFPAVLQSFFADQLINQFTITGAAAFGYRHPLVLTMLMIIAILLPSRFLTGEIESGRMEVLLALPVTRATVFMTLWAAMMVMLFCVTAGGWCGTFLAKWLFPEAANIPSAGILRIGLNLWILSLCVSALTCLIAAYVHEYGRAALLSAGVTFVMFLLYYVSSLWPAARFLAPFSVMNYYSPQNMLAQSPDFYQDIFILVLISAICLVLALRRFIQRDIPG